MKAGQLKFQVRNERQRGSEALAVARGQVVVGDLARDALDVADPFQRIRDAAADDGRIVQLLHAVQPRADVLFAAQRIEHELVHPPRPHRSLRLIQKPQKRAAALAVAQRAHEFEVGDRRRVEHHHLAGADQTDAVDVAQGMLLRLAQIFDQRPRRADGGGQPREPERLERLAAQLFHEGLFGPTRRERPRRIAGKRGQGAQGGLPLRAEQISVVADDLRRGELDQLFQAVTQKGVPRKYAGAKFARRDVRPRQRAQRAVAEGAGDVIVLFFVDQVIFDERARRNDADDVPFDHPLTGRRLGQLLADGDLLAHADQAGDIRVRRMKGNAAHRRALFQAAVAPGQRQIEELRDLLRVLKKHLIKISQPIKHDAVFVLLFDLEIVPHHRRKSAHPSPPYSFAATSPISEMPDESMTRI